EAQIPGAPFSVLISAPSVTISNPVTYTISITNQTGVPLQNLFVTNTWSETVFVSAQIIDGNPGNIVTNGNLVFDLGTLNFGNFRKMTVTATATNAGPLTNFVVIPTSTVTNLSTTNVLVQVTNAAPPAPVDLSVSVTGHSFPPLVNDWLPFSVTVS